jgi:hypothetical protein
MSKNKPKPIPKIVCCRDTNIMEHSSIKRERDVTPDNNASTRKEKRRKAFHAEETSVNTGGNEAASEKDFSIETGMDLAVAEQVELLEKRVSYLEDERRVMFNDIGILTNRIKACKEEQEHAWECRNKFIGLHNEKLATYIEKLQAYTCEKLHGIHTAIAEKHLNIVNKLETTEKALRGCWFATDNKVDLLWQKEEERREAEETSGMEGRR